MSMRKNRNGVWKERMIMLVSSALVLTVLTVTGVFIRSSRQTEDENNVLDFSAIEGDEGMEENELLFTQTGSDDLDYDPYFQEANSDNVENQDLVKKDKEKDKENDKADSDTKNQTTETKKTDKAEEETEAIATSVQPVLDFTEEDRLIWPIVGDVLLNYSMDKTIYFPTLEQYKYNPAIVISAALGETITAAADGRVVSVAYDAQLGNTIVMDLGNQYELTYGQLENIVVSEGSYVSAGDILGNVATPTKYYSTEGANVYFKLTKDGEPVNPLSKLN